MMRLSLVTDILGYLPFEDMLDTVSKLGFEAVELGSGNWSKAPHLRLDDLLSSVQARQDFRDALERRGLSISALNCSGNQLHPGPSGEEHRAVVEKTFRLAEKLDVKTVVMMSGCPGGTPKDELPNWITHVILPEQVEALDYQWNGVLIPYFQKAAMLAKDCGIRVAIENLGATMIHNPATMLRLREHVDSVIGMNFDPSHHMWMGGDPIAAVRLLGDAIHYMHAKDVRLERTLAEANGLIDTYWINDIQKRSWNYVALGHGHDVQWWKEFFAVALMVGYDGPVSLEMEDAGMDPLLGVKKSLTTLKLALPRDFD
ncbi:sugar phosphate isomerase/epimerase family protein [Rhizobium sullae]|uniref:Sugar phosphate isomerase/epimerase n=1 Tax=Rhizobium sullae TaxID=50338 RepID=A0A4R3Q0E8_RHISU|nr:sugar phosphate isomerase/epimerase [Rhizobium sullae]TCU13687.1 sugar phosphate isomerase/epimerase [Rhizobium sullae]